MGGVGERHAQIFGLAAGITAGQVGIAEQPRGGMAEYLLGEVLLPVGALAHRVIAATALIAFPTGDREGNDDAISLAERMFGAAADLDDLAHRLMAKNVARQHCRNEVMKKMEVGS